MKRIVIAALSAGIVGLFAGAFMFVLLAEVICWLAGANFDPVGGVAMGLLGATMGALAFSGAARVIVEDGT